MTFKGAGNVTHSHEDKKVNEGQPPFQRALILESRKNFKAGVTAKLNELKENTLGMNNMIENLSKETN